MASHYEFAWCFKLIQQLYFEICLSWKNVEWRWQDCQVGRSGGRGNCGDDSGGADKSLLNSSRVECQSFQDFFYLKYVELSQTNLLVWNSKL